VGVASLEELPPAPGHQLLVNLAGAPIMEGRWTEARKTELLQSRLRVTRAVVSYAARCEAAAPTKDRVLVSASAVGYYGYHQDEPLTEEAPTEAGDFLAGVCNAWEKAAELATAEGLRTCLLRIGVVLGPGGGAVSKMLPAFRKGLGGRIGSGEQYMSWVHLDDLVGLIEFLSARSDLSGPFNATAPNPVTNRDFTAALGVALGRPTFLAVPSFALRVALGEAADVLIGGQRVMPKRALDAGYTFKHPEVLGALKAIVR
jgi:uncharacterized protein